MTSRNTATGGNSSTLLADQTITTAGATGTRTDTFSTKANLVGVFLALKPATATYGYDTLGNRTTTQTPGGTAVTLGYDQANRLKTYGTTANYTYNGDGLRQAKTVSGNTTQQTWDVSNQLPALIVDGTTNYVYGVGGLPIEQVSAAATLYYQQDQLGSTRALTDSAGSIAATYTYDAYGRASGSTGSATTPLGFGGQYTDTENGLQYLRSRYYDPTTAAFLTRDPVVGQTRQAYTYAENDPLNATDASGLSSCAVRASTGKIPKCAGGAQWRRPNSYARVKSLGGGAWEFIDHLSLARQDEIASQGALAIAQWSANYTIFGPNGLIARGQVFDYGPGHGDPYPLPLDYGAHGTFHIGAKAGKPPIPPGSILTIFTAGTLVYGGPSAFSGTYSCRF
jgi:RHS repeat-associated protein